MARFSNPKTAINYLAESSKTRPRTPHKITYVELARKSGIDVTTIWRILNGKVKASHLVAERFERLATAEAERRRDLTRQTRRQQEAARG